MGSFAVIFVIAVLLDIWIASVAKNKGESFAGYLVFGLLLSPIVSGLMLLTIKAPLPHPAAWLPDPGHTGYLRWWDGFRWTDHYHPAVAPTGMGEPA